MAGLLVAALTLGPALTACSGGAEAPAPTPESSPEGAPADATPIEVPPPVARGLRRALERRTRALAAGDRALFLRGVAADDALRAAQATYFDNLQQLPATDLRYRISPRTVVRADDDYWVVVRFTMRLQGYDAVPVSSLERYRFSPVDGAAGSRFVVSSVTDPAWQEKQQMVAQPWDLSAIQVRERDGVLGIFDEGSVAQAPSLLRTTARSIGQVAALVPYEWSGRVVLLALSDPTFLRSLEVPGGDPDQVDGLTVDVRTGSDGVLASSRVVLHPDVVAAPGAQRTRLVRHELTHVAVGEHDDAAPLWLTEGLAEWVSTRPIRPERRTVPDAAVVAAERSELTDLPTDEDFDDTDNDVDYALSWFAVEYLAGLFGPESVWTVLDELHEAGAVPDDDPDSRLEAISQLNTRILARRAAKLIVERYGERPRTDDPSPSAPAETKPTGPGGREAASRP